MVALEKGSLRIAETVVHFEVKQQKRAVVNAKRLIRMTKTTFELSGALQISCDILVVADVARRSDTGLRIRREIECYHEMGYRVAIRHVKNGKSLGAASPDIQHCVNLGLAEIVVSDAAVDANVVLVFSPTQIDRQFAGFENLTARRVILIVDSLPDYADLSTWSLHEKGIEEIVLAPTNRWVREAVVKQNLPLRIEAEDWRSVASAVDPLGKRELPDRRLVVGRFSAPGESQWPTKKKLFETYGFRNEVEFLFVGYPPDQLRAAVSQRKSWTGLKFDTISGERFVDLVDAIAYFPSARAPELPEAVIAAAMASGKPVFLPPRFKPHFGPGAIYCSADVLKAEIRNWFADTDALKAFCQEAKRQAGFQFSKDVLSGRIQKLAGPPSKVASRARTRHPKKPRVLFVPSNGVGLGHVTRLLAIARRMDAKVEPVFATLAQAAPIIEASGYAAEYIPSQSDTGEAYQTWDKWFGYQLRELVERYQVSAVVFDGNHPSDGLIQAVGARVGCKLVWVRRGMLGKKVTPFIDNTRFMNLIIEPSEAARERQNGVLASRRAEVLEVPPITLLDSSEALPRHEARDELGLNQEKAAVLVQLGAGANRDVLGLADKVVKELSKLEALQIVVAEWENGLVRMPVWPGARVLRGFPISRFLNAFDFSVSAAGYNTYHEVLRFALPTIFLANRNPQLDDQWSRAEFAQDKQAGFNLAEDELFQLPALCEALSNEAVRQVIRQNCLDLIDENGAASAAKAISQLMRVS